MEWRSKRGLYGNMEFEHNGFVLYLRAGCESLERLGFKVIVQVLGGLAITLTRFTSIAHFRFFITFDVAFIPS